ncbi:MAG: HEAT repeat domain-containing protein [Geobacter sp.]|nr:HEAT repeat domain-containing protein [Geobacter sp.]
MPKQFEVDMPFSGLEGKSAEELLLLVGDADKGWKRQAIDQLLVMGFETVYSIVEKALRDNDNADLRNGAMEILVNYGRTSLSRLYALLRDEDEEVRNFSAVMLGDIGAREAVGHLVHAMSDADANVRHSAAEALGKIGDRGALKPLIGLLREDFWLQYPAIVALAEMRDERAVPHLLQLLSDEMLIGPVVEALGRIGDPLAMPHLGEILSSLDSTFAAVTARAIVSIQKNINDTSLYRNRLSAYSQQGPLPDFVSQQGIENLKTLLIGRDSEETVDCAIQLLGWLGQASVLPDLFRLLEAKDRHLATVEGAILALGKPAMEYLLPALSHQALNVKIVVLRSFRWLGGIDDVRLLNDMLSSEPEVVQLEALELLKSKTDDKFLPLLAQLIKTGSQALRVKALEVVSRYPAAVIAPILRELQASSDVEKRKSAAVLVGLADDGINFDTLKPWFADPSTEVRKEAIKASGIRKFVDAVPLLLKELTDTDPCIREEAVLALAEFGDSAPMADILRLLEAGDERLDYVIIQTAGKVGYREAGNVLAEYLGRGNIPRYLEFAIIDTFAKLGELGETECQLVEGYLKHENPDLRRLAVQALVSMAGAGAAQFVLPVCADSHWSVRIAALQALRNVNGKNAIPRLLAALSDSDQMVRKNAILLLGEFRESSTIYDLVRLLTDSEMSRYAFDALLQFDRTALPWLHRIMKGNYSLEIRERVIDLIGKIGESKSVEPLRKMLDDDSPDIRLAAIDSLIFCCDSLTLKKLSYIKQHDNHEDVRNKAAIALKFLLAD